MTLICKDIEVGDGAIMTIPIEGAEWNLRYGNIEITRHQTASIVSSYRYLLIDCTMKEAIRRLRIMRRDARMVPSNPQSNGDENATLS